MGRSELMCVPQSDAAPAARPRAISATRQIVAPAVAVLGAACCNDSQLSRWCDTGRIGACRSERCGDRAHGHLPRIDAWPASGGGLQVVVSNRHEMSDGHHILRHALLDGDLQLLAERHLDPRCDARAVSQFHLPAYHGQLYALSVCSRDGLWMNAVEI